MCPIYADFKHFLIAKPRNFRFAATVADRFFIVEHGKIIDGFASAELQANMTKLHTYLGV